MRLFKIKNKGLRYLMGAVVLLVTIGVGLAVLSAIGYGMALLDEKCLGWEFFSGDYSGITALVFFLLTGVLTIGLVVLSGLAVACIISGSKALGDKLFNNIR